MGCSSSDRPSAGEDNLLGSGRRIWNVRTCSVRRRGSVVLAHHPQAPTPSLAGAMGENRQAMVGARF